MKQIFDKSLGARNTVFGRQYRIFRDSSLSSREFKRFDDGTMQDIHILRLFLPFPSAEAGSTEA